MHKVNVIVYDSEVYDIFNLRMLGWKVLKSGICIESYVYSWLMKCCIVDF